MAVVKAPDCFPDVLERDFRRIYDEEMAGLPEAWPLFDIDFVPRLSFWEKIKKAWRRVFMIVPEQETGLQGGLGGQLGGKQLGGKPADLAAAVASPTVRDKVTRCGLKVEEIETGLARALVCIRGTQPDSALKTEAPVGLLSELVQLEEGLARIVSVAVELEKVLGSTDG
jgi:hypothetical protein